MQTNELYKKVDQLKSDYEKLLPMKREDEDRLWQKFRLEWDYNSNHLEGNTLTYHETQLLLIFDKTIGDHALREYEEMQAHDVAIHLVKDWAKDTSRDLSETDIRDLNRIILVKPFWKEAITYDGQPTRRLIKVGEYKEQPNSVRLKSGEIFHFASPEETPRLMGELMDWFRSEKTLDPIVLASEFHYRFIRIHPFDDGNGRVARLLVNYVLMKNKFPPVIVKSADKENYFTALQKGDAGDRDAFYEYMAKQLLWSLELSITAGKGEKIEEPDDVDKEINLLTRQLKGKNKLTEKRTVENVAFVIEENIISLFKLIESKCEGLKELFFDWNRVMQFQIGGGLVTNQVGSKKTDWNTLIQIWLNEQIRKERKTVHNYKYTFTLAGLKNSLAANSFWVSIEVYFHDYNYMIQVETPRVQQFNFPYGKKLTPEELLAIANPAVKNLVANIKQVM